MLLPALSTRDEQAADESVAVLSWKEFREAYKSIEKPQMKAMVLMKKRARAIPADIVSKNILGGRSDELFTVFSGEVDELELLARLGCRWKPFGLDTSSIALLSPSISLPTCIAYFLIFTLLTI